MNTLLIAPLILLSTLPSTPTQAGSPGPLIATYPAQVVRVIDGDTIKVDILIWIDTTLRVSLRLDGLDTPDKPCDKEATWFTETWIKDALPVYVQQPHYGKYSGRVIGNLVSPTKGDLGQALLKSGLARKYTGGRREKWCGGPPP